MTEILQIDDLAIEVRRSTRRRHVDVTVERDGSLVVAVPARLDEEEIEKLVRSRLVSLHATLGRKKAVLSRQPAKEYVTGEGFYYLGRKYRLKLVDPGQISRPLTLSQGRFLLSRDCTSQGRKHFVQWYTAHAEKWLVDRVASLQDRVAATPKSVHVRDLGYRWGSCTGGGKVNFHWRCVLLPAKRVDYLVLHELCHLHEHHHGPEFYERLRRASPDYEQHEKWLRDHGDEYQL